jgi:uncharacterized protein
MRIYKILHRNKPLIMLTKLVITCVVVIVTASTIYILLVGDKLPVSVPFSNKNRGFESLLKGVPSTPNSKYTQAIVTANGFDIRADLAITGDQHIKGLSIKDHLRENQGMLFMFDTPGKYDFWMKDMKFPLDIIWLDNNRTVVHIEHDLVPCHSDFQCPTYSSQKDSLYVLETVAGFSQKHRVNIGTRIDFHVIR